MLSGGNTQGQTPVLKENLRLPVCICVPQVSSYRYLDGMESLMIRLNEAGYQLHAMSNYPVWWMLIEEKLRVSRYLKWTFVSCTGPMKVRTLHRHDLCILLQCCSDTLPLS